MGARPALGNGAHCLFVGVPFGCPEARERARLFTVMGAVIGGKVRPVRVLCVMLLDRYNQSIGLLAPGCGYSNMLYPVWSDEMACMHTHEHSLSISLTRQHTNTHTTTCFFFLSNTQT